VFTVFEDGHELIRESLLKTNVEQEFKSDGNVEVYSLRYNGSKFITYSV